jgi:hypothetical protein
MPTILRLIDARNIDCPSAKIQYIPPDLPAVNGTGLRPISFGGRAADGFAISGAIGNLTGGGVKSSTLLLVGEHRA